MPPVIAMTGTIARPIVGTVIRAMVRTVVWTITGTVVGAMVRTVTAIIVITVIVIIVRWPLAGTIDRPLTTIGIIRTITGTVVMTPFALCRIAAAAGAILGRKIGEWKRHDYSHEYSQCRKADTRAKPV